MPAETGNAVHLSTKLGLISAENFLESSGNNALYQSHPAVRYITQQMLQSTISPLPFLLTSFFSLPWPTWPLSLLLTVKQWQP
jgi:hypothetical protein